MKPYVNPDGKTRCPVCGHPHLPMPGSWRTSDGTRINPVCDWPMGPEACKCRRRTLGKKAAPAVLPALDVSLPCGYEFRGSHGPYHCHKIAAAHVGSALGHDFVPWERRRGTVDRRTALPVPALDALRFAKALTEYGVHQSNCPYESWNKSSTRCKCGLFALIKEANAALREDVK